jgi:hypothetical protein
MIAEQIRERYLCDPLKIRLGGLAADLTRIASCADNPKNHEAVAYLLDEGKHFAEWTAPDAPLETQAVLAEIQLALAIWERAWHNGETAPNMQDEARRRADELLRLAGYY